MKDRTVFILKVLILSTSIAISIKYAGKFVTVAPTTIRAAIAISFLPLLMSLLLGWRWLARFKITSKR
ncbi:MAG: hypothetical protein ACFBSE_24910 [Prochloraceae cyanobacterium]